VSNEGRKSGRVGHVTAARGASEAPPLNRVEAFLERPAPSLVEDSDRKARENETACLLPDGASGWPSRAASTLSPRRERVALRVSEGSGEGVRLSDEVDSPVNERGPPALCWTLPRATV